MDGAQYNVSPPVRALLSRGNISRDERNRSMRCEEFWTGMKVDLWGVPLLEKLKTETEQKWVSSHTNGSLRLHLGLSPIWAEHPSMLTMIMLLGLLPTISVQCQVIESTEFTNSLLFIQHVFSYGSFSDVIALYLCSHLGCCSCNLKLDILTLSSLWDSFLSFLI